MLRSCRREKQKPHQQQLRTLEPLNTLGNPVQGSGGACRLFCPTKKLSAPFAEIRWVGNARTGIDMRAKTRP